jgi:hypothetical protein
MRTDSVRTVPRIVTDDQKCGLHISPDILHNAEMFESGITGNETWCLLYQPKTKIPEHSVENLELTFSKGKHTFLTHSLHKDK